MLGRSAYSIIIQWHFDGYIASLCPTENFCSSSLPGFIRKMTFPSRQNRILRLQPNEAKDLISSPWKKWHCIIDQSRTLTFIWTVWPEITSAVRICKDFTRNQIAYAQWRWLEAALPDTLLIKHRQHMNRGKWHILCWMCWEASEGGGAFMSTWTVPLWLNDWSTIQWRKTCHPFTFWYFLIIHRQKYVYWQTASVIEPSKGFIRTLQGN